VVLLPREGGVPDVCNAHLPSLSGAMGGEKDGRS
jgi:hypothetical protein